MTVLLIDHEPSSLNPKPLTLLKPAMFGFRWVLKGLDGNIGGSTGLLLRNESPLQEKVA